MGIMTTHDLPQEITLSLLTAPAMTALLEGDLPRASAITGWLWRYRIRQIEADPAAAPWLVRAVVLRSDDVAIGHAGFHGPPDARGMVEIGYRILPDYRRRGYGRMVARTLIQEAAAHPEVQVIRASISPSNAASLALIRPLDFSQVGEQWDEEDGLELVFERPARIQDISRRDSSHGDA
jgi:[ribosomal protein S5]-alanine N-acetyltransferase